MEATTLIVQSNLVSNMTAPMAIAAHELGIPVIDISTHNLSKFNPSFNGKPFLYGSVQLLQWGLKQQSIKDNILWDETRLSAETWAEKLGGSFLNVYGRRDLAGNAPEGWHVRPIRNDKSFTGTTSCLNEEHHCTDSWISPPRDIDAEVRVFVVDRKAVSASYYRKENKTIAERADLSEFALPSWLPFDSCVVDFGLVEGEWKIIEFNSIHTSAHYACDQTAILRAIFYSLNL